MMDAATKADLERKVQLKLNALRQFDLMEQAKIPCPFKRPIPRIEIPEGVTRQDLEAEFNRACAEYRNFRTDIWVPSMGAMG